MKKLNISFTDIRPGFVAVNDGVCLALRAIYDTLAHAWAGSRAKFNSVLTVCELNKLLNSL